MTRFDIRKRIKQKSATIHKNWKQIAFLPFPRVFCQIFAFLPLHTTNGPIFPFINHFYFFRFKKVHFGIVNRFRHLNLRGGVNLCSSKKLHRPVNSHGSINAPGSAHLATRPTPATGRCGTQWGIAWRWTG